MAPRETTNRTALGGPQFLQLKKRDRTLAPDDLLALTLKWTGGLPRIRDPGGPRAALVYRDGKAAAGSKTAGPTAQNGALDRLGSVYSAFAV